MHPRPQLEGSHVKGKLWVPANACPWVPQRSDRYSSNSRRTMEWGVTQKLSQLARAGLGESRNERNWSSDCARPG
jgi:hypothetical protein